MAKECRRRFDFGRLSSLGFWPGSDDILAMTLKLPESIERRLSPQSTALHLAIGLFVAEEATLGQAAQVAGLSQANFLRELGKRRIPIHYGQEELAADLEAVESLTGQ
jgi:predicted HTH domain antitoxin